MSFREKSAWISFITLFVVSAVYFGQTVLHEMGMSDHGSGNSATLFFLSFTALIISEVGLHMWIRRQSPHDARTPRDEREQLIDLRATRVAFFVLLAGAMTLIFTMHLRVNRWQLIQMTLFAVVVAELAKFASQIVFYRRDAA